METTTTTTQTAIKWGAIAGLLSVILSTITFVMALETSDSPLKWVVFLVSFLIMIGVLVYAMKEYKSKNGGFMSYGQGLGIGAMLGGVAGLIGAIYGVVYNKFIDPTHLDKIKDFQIEAFEKQGLSSEQIEQGLKMSEMISNTGTVFVISVIGSIIFYFIISLAVSAFQKNEKPTFE